MAGLKCRIRLLRFALSRSRGRRSPGFHCQLRFRAGVRGRRRKELLGRLVWECNLDEVRQHEPVDAEVPRPDQPRWESTPVAVGIPVQVNTVTGVQNPEPLTSYSALTCRLLAATGLI